MYVCWKLSMNIGLSIDWKNPQKKQANAIGNEWEFGLFFFIIRAMNYIDIFYN